MIFVCRGGDEKLEASGRPNYDQQSATACGCTAGVALMTRDYPVMSFDRAVEQKVVTGWQARRMEWEDRRHYLIMGGPGYERFDEKEAVTEEFYE